MVATDRKRIFKFILSAFFLSAFVVLFLPFYAEILLAAVFAFAMEPTLGRWLQPRHLRWRVSVALILFGMFVAIAVPMTVVGYKTYSAVMETSKTGFTKTEIYGKLVIVKDRLVTFANKTASRFGMEDQFDLGSMAEDSFGKTATTVLNILTTLMSEIPAILLSIFVFCAALYFFLAEAAVIKQIFNRQKLLSPHESDRLINVFQRASAGTVISTVIIGLIQASVVSLGSLIFGIGDLTVVFVITFFASFIPVLGAGPVSLALAAYALLMEDYSAAIGMGVAAAVAGTLDNLVRPYLVSSSEADLHPIVSLLAIIGALIIFGMPGLLLGPVIASVAVKIIPTLYSGPGKIDP